MALEPNPNIFANNPLDRVSDKRTDDEWLKGKMEDPESRYVPFYKLMPFVLPEAAPSEGKDIAWMPPEMVKPLMNPASTTVLLGINKRGRALFATDVTFGENPENGPLKGMGEFEDLRGLAMKGEITSGELAIMAQGKSMIDWHLRHGYCSACGHPSRMAEAGYKRVCPECGAEHFPRTDPVAIMLATRGDMALLGRQPMFPKGMFSSLAGFIEPGESIEEAVAREMMEEAGVAVHNVRYHSTQPWPYPSQLMIGCHCEAETEEITVDGVELDEARWFSRDDLRAVLAGEDKGFWVPPPFAIAHQLIKSWVAEG
ncbi:NADH pyrophosphatase [Candidatus Phaeomarinobacter ectocarpi]|uniref:NAD(+) diphosphatase n=1 Tax=Candidatus Phaeomarinibacter ectocarpi TaxID=1458461 RepID=X5MDA6_9HYPH|nr:NAD(+) diphosphatase [Candidatus Phaeomarinobacter ectocarpi]CDO58289.1 NADH pyrophosphatase [Candidatus Phaeomarinobacter ectocarpi]